MQGRDFISILSMKNGGQTEAQIGEWTSHRPGRERAAFVSLFRVLSPLLDPVDSPSSQFFIRTRAGMDRARVASVDLKPPGVRQVGGSAHAAPLWGLHFRRARVGRLCRGHLVRLLHCKEKKSESGEGA